MEEISVDQIEKFVNDSKKLEWKWKRIRLMGGEALLHSRFFEILEVIKELKVENQCQVEIFTNGFGPQVKKLISELPRWIDVVNSNKNSNFNYFSSYNVAPIDSEKYRDANFSRGCLITSRDGLGLSRYGFYPCGPGASVDRVFGFNIGIKKLSNTTDLGLKNQLEQLCKYCGHYKENFSTNLISDEQISESWKKAYQKYKNSKPELSLC